MVGLSGNIPVAISVAGVALLLAVGARLLALSRGRMCPPEFWLGCFFVLYLGFSVGMSCLLYLGLSHSDLAHSPTLGRSIHALQYLLSIAGIASLLFFTRITFRPKSMRAEALATTLIAVMLIAFCGVGYTEGFEVRVLNGTWYWIYFLAKNCVFAWLALESLRCWRHSAKRLGLGLANPLVVNRFLLWSLWAGIQGVLALGDPIARLWYVAVSGSTTEWIPELGGPIVMNALAITIAGSALSGATLVLSFVPTQAYQRWVEGRATTWTSSSATQSHTP